MPDENFTLIALDNLEKIHHHFDTSSDSYIVVGPEPILNSEGVAYCASARNAIFEMDRQINLQKYENESLKNKLSEKELAYDEIVQALLNTEIGKAHNRNNTKHPDILSHIDAVIIIQTMEQALQQCAVINEIPSGPCEPDEEICALRQRVAELELQLDLAGAEHRALQKHILDFCGRISADIAYELRSGK